LFGKPLAAKDNIMAKKATKQESQEPWGLCKDCKWFQIEPKASPGNDTMGLCIEEKLQPFLLRVSGKSGCNRFLPGTPAKAAGSSKAPPEAKPTR